jgi:pre-mRNA-processing factor 19
MFCAISGAPPEEPVASRKSGHVFERRLAEKYVAETGRCPVTGDPLTADDLLPLVPAAATGAAAPPRPAPASSVPGLIALLRDEWDASALEAHALRSQLHSARQELAHALYQHDAACRVIARLLRERDEARAALESGGAPRGVGGGGEAAVQNGGGGGHKRARAEAEEQQQPEQPQPPKPLPKTVAEDLAAVSAELSKARRARVVPAMLASPEQVASFAPSAAHPLHAMRPAGGILAVAALGNLVATGGADGAVGLLDLASGRVLPGAPLKTSGGKKVTCVAFGGGSGNCVLSASPAERAVRVWRAPEDAEGEAWTCAHTLEAAAAAGGAKSGGDLVGVAAHPSGRYALSATADGGWLTWDLASGERLRAVGPPSSANGASCHAVALHPDGLIAATLQGARVLLWEVSTGTCAAALPPAEESGDSSPSSTCLSFSENGYHLAVGSSDGRVRVWDLRKSRLVRTLEAFSSSLEGEGAGAGGAGGGGGSASPAPVTSVAFDHSGSYLAVAGGTAGVKVYQTGKSEWRELAAWPASAVAKKAAAAVAWAADAKALLVAGSDHNLRVLEAPSKGE